MRRPEETLTDHHPYMLWLTYINSAKTLAEVQSGTFPSSELLWLVITVNTLLWLVDIRAVWDAHYHANDGLHPPLSRDVHCKAGEKCISLFYVIMSCYIGPSAKLWNEWAGLILYRSCNNVFHHDMSILAPLNISKLRSPWSLWTFIALQILHDDYQKRLEIETSNPI